MSEKLVSTETNAKRISQIDQCFGSTYCQGLAKPGRLLVGEGILLKMCRKKAKRRQVFLFNDIFVYANIVIKNKKFIKQTVIPLEELKVIPLYDDSYSGYRNGWQVISPLKSFVLFASTLQEKASWIKYTNLCRQKILASKNIDSFSSSNHSESSPVWVPDGETSICMHCRKSQFTFLNRRHHCRKCGIVCCSDCSDRKFHLSYLSANKPVRVCRTCYNKLTIAALQGSVHGNPATTGDCSDSDSGDDGLGRSNSVEEDGKEESLFYGDPTSWH